VSSISPVRRRKQALPCTAGPHTPSGGRLRIWPVNRTVPPSPTSRAGLSQPPVAPRPRAGGPVLLPYGRCKCITPFAPAGQPLGGLPPCRPRSLFSPAVAARSRPSGCVPRPAEPRPSRRRASSIVRRERQCPRRPPRCLCVPLGPPQPPAPSSMPLVPPALRSKTPRLRNTEASFPGSPLFSLLQNRVPSGKPRNEGPRPGPSPRPSRVPSSACPARVSSAAGCESAGFPGGLPWSNTFWAGGRLHPFPNPMTCIAYPPSSARLAAKQVFDAFVTMAGANAGTSGVAHPVSDRVRPTSSGTRKIGPSTLTAPAACDSSSSIAGPAAAPAQSGPAWSGRLLQRCPMPSRKPFFCAAFWQHAASGRLAPPPNPTRLPSIGPALAASTSTVRIVFS